jgi:drug/metabolite transporter (DMT)-like permease
MTAMILFMAGLWILPFAMLWGDLKFFGETGWYALIYTAIFCTVLPFVFWLRALHYISATYSAAILLLEPVFAAVLGFLILNERLTLAEMLGAVLILVAIGVISVSKR